MPKFSLKISIAIVGCLVAAGLDQVVAAQPVKPSGADRSFVRETALNAAGTLAEAKLALKQTQRGDIRNFAEDVLTEHAASDAQLRQIASAGGVEMPSPAASADRGASLAKLSGAAFDQRYIADAQASLSNDIEVAAREGEGGTNPGLQYFASQRLPRLLAEQRLLEQIAAGSTIGAEPSPPPLGWQYQPPPLVH